MSNAWVNPEFNYNGDHYTNDQDENGFMCQSFCQITPTQMYILGSVWSETYSVDEGPGVLYIFEDATDTFTLVSDNIKTYIETLCQDTVDNFSDNNMTFSAYSYSYCQIGSTPTACIIPVNIKYTTAGAIPIKTFIVLSVNKAGTITTVFDGMNEHYHTLVRDADYDPLIQGFTFAVSPYVTFSRCILNKTYLFLSGGVCFPESWEGTYVAGVDLIHAWTARDFYMGTPYQEILEVNELHQFAEVTDTGITFIHGKEGTETCEGFLNDREPPRYDYYNLTKYVGFSSEAYEALENDRYSGAMYNQNAELIDVFGEYKGVFVERIEFEWDIDHNNVTSMKAYRRLVDAQRNEWGSWIQEATVLDPAIESTKSAAMFDPPAVQWAGYVYRPSALYKESSLTVQADEMYYSDTWTWEGQGWDRYYLPDENAYWTYRGSFFITPGQHYDFLYCTEYSAEFPVIYLNQIYTFLSPITINTGITPEEYIEGEYDYILWQGTPNYGSRSYKYIYGRFGNNLGRIEYVPPPMQPTSITTDEVSLYIGGMAYAGSGVESYSFYTDDFSNASPIYVELTIPEVVTGSSDYTNAVGKYWEYIGYNGYSIVKLYMNDVITHGNIDGGKVYNMCSVYKNDISEGLPAGISTSVDFSAATNAYLSINVGEVGYVYKWVGEGAWTKVDEVATENISTAHIISLDDVFLAGHDGSSPEVERTNINLIDVQPSNTNLPSGVYITDIEEDIWNDR